MKKLNAKIEEVMNFGLRSWVVSVRGVMMGEFLTAAAAAEYIRVHGYVTEEQ